MTRAEEKPIEVIVRRAMLQHLKNEHFQVEEIPRDKHDKPDMLFRVDGQRIACESTSAPDDTIMRNVNKNRSELLAAKEIIHIEIIWPKEPHLWIKKAIEKKNKKIDCYKNETSANEVWLLVHPYDPDNKTFCYDKSSVLEMVKFGAKAAQHEFDKVFVWDPCIGVTQIYPCNDVWDKIPWKDMFDDYPAGGYPAEGCVTVGGVNSNAVPEGYLGLIERGEISVTPFEPEFQGLEPNYKPVNRYATKKIVNGQTKMIVSAEPSEEEP